MTMRKVSHDLEKFVASAVLTSLLKSEGGIHSIAMSSIWRRLVSKVSMKEVNKDVACYLNDFQIRLGYMVVLRPFYTLT